MEQIDLKQLIEQYPEVLTDGTKLKAYILDLYPQCKRGMVNILVAIQQCGIVSEMQANKNTSALDMCRWKKVLDDDYGFAGATAEACLQMWCIAVGIQLEIKVKATQKTNIVRPKEEKEKNQSKQTSISSKLQNSQKDWFEYNGSTLLKLKEEHRLYCGKIYVPNTVKDIDAKAFRGSKLTSIIIPDSVKSIGYQAFAGCSGLTDIIIGKSVTRIGDEAFWGCSSLTSIVIPNSVKDIGKALFYYCNNLESITFSDNATGVPSNIFTECKNLTSFKIPDSIVYIHSAAFSRCGLTSITIPYGVRYIDRCAFDGCADLISLAISDTVTYIGSCAFANCKSLTTVVIPDSVKIIDDEAFSSCWSLTSITIGKNVEMIGEHVFSWCGSLSTINYRGTKEKWNSIRKKLNWDNIARSYIVHCTDGDIPKNES